MDDFTVPDSEDDEIFIIGRKRTRTLEVDAILVDQVEDYFVGADASAKSGHSLFQRLTSGNMFLSKKTKYLNILKGVRGASTAVKTQPHFKGTIYRMLNIPHIISVPLLIHAVAFHKHSSSTNIHKPKSESFEDTCEVKLEIIAIYKYYETLNTYLYLTVCIGSFNGYELSDTCTREMVGRNKTFTA